MDEQETRTPDEWCRALKVRVLDPDGWRNDGKGWGEPVTETEFRERAAWSTSDWSASVPSGGDEA